MRPLIGITSYAQPARWGAWELPAALVPLFYVESVERAGGRALVIPPSTDAVDETLDVLDGVVFSGGIDIDPATYGAERHPATDPAQAHRDAGELALLSRALERDVPTLAICRGFQLLNILRGGDLVQHLPETVGHEGHREVLGTFSEHPVEVKGGTRLASILGERHDSVQSSHHQGVGRVGEGLVETAWADGRLAGRPRGPGQALRRRRPLAPGDGGGQATLRRARRRGAPIPRGAERRADGDRMTDAVTSFHSQLPVRIAFGDGVIAELPDALRSLGATGALVVVEEPVAGHVEVVSALAAAEDAGVRLERFVKGPGEPTFALADELAVRVRDGGFDAVAGIGGGSALDVAKAARIAADQGGSTADYAGGARTPEPPRIGLVLCPTTAGTGSEVSGASVLTDTERDRKIGFGHPNMRAQHALVDPVLTYGLPATPTAHSGVDAMAQAIGGCTVANSSPLSVAFGLEACHHVAHSLLPAIEDGSNAEARRRLAVASLTAGSP